MVYAAGARAPYSCREGIPSLTTQRACGESSPPGGPPPDIHGYVAHVRVRHHELDALGHVNNAAYLNYLEQAGIEHSTALGYGGERLRQLGGLFIARRHEIDYLRPALAGDLLQIVTWIGEQRGAQAVREYALARLATADRQNLPADRFLAPGFALPEAILVRARTYWVWVGADDGRPRRPPPDLRTAFQRPSLPE